MGPAPSSLRIAKYTKTQTESLVVEKVMKSELTHVANFHTDEDYKRVIELHMHLTKPGDLIYFLAQGADFNSIMGSYHSLDVKVILIEECLSPDFAEARYTVKTYKYRLATFDVDLAVDTLVDIFI
jgi:hypothetical protein